MIYHRARLEWACRRGMLELDVLLGNFLKKAYFNLPLAQQKLFVRLLHYSDSELFAWLIERKEPPEQEFVNIINLIRYHTQSQ
jgi:antitoxin CptB